MKFVDYHIHSTFSHDGHSSLFQMCQKAVDLGIEEIGFSEHMDFEPEDWAYGYFNYKQYTHQIEQAQTVFNNQIVIQKGI